MNKFSNLIISKQKENTSSLNNEIKNISSQMDNKFSDIIINTEFNIKSIKTTLSLNLENVNENIKL